ncbi:MAG: SDR family oxidoreductase [Hyphomicrobiaceae bacterium]|nr:SDR family oxidoreductase [Hyphomicrobiaceae bacterium]
MFMSVVTHSPGVPVYAELAGARVVITGLTPDTGVDLARAFADHKCRVVVQTPDDGPEMAAVATLLSESAAEIALFTQTFGDAHEAVRFAQGPAMSFGGLDVAINLVRIGAADLAGKTSLEAIDDLVSERLLAPTLMTRVIANRMRLTMTEGLILNVVMTERPADDASEVMIGILRSAVATITRREAQQWAGEGVRINAVGPRGFMDASGGGACLTSGPDIAALALYLAGRKGRQLSGHVFDAEGVATRGC